MSRPRFSFVLCILISTIVSSRALGLATEHMGPDLKAHAQPGSAHGLVTLPRDPSRVYSIWVNGNETFYFNAESDQIKQLITNFSKVRLRDHVVRLTVGSPAIKSFKGQSFSYNVSLNVLDGIALWHARSQAKEPSTFEPVLTIHVDGEELEDLLTEFQWPENIILQNELPGSELTSAASVPARKLLHAAVHFENDRPAADFEGGTSTTISLWNRDAPHGINLGKVTHKGTFNVAMSLREIAQLRDEDTWLTMTVGNALTTPKPTDPRLPVDRLVFQADEAKPVRVSRPAAFHGRIVFEDGSDLIMNPEPWPGAEIKVTFPYAGVVRPNKQGYFEVTFTDDQLEELKQNKPRRNVYVPLYESRNRSRALHAFPAEKLTQNRDSVFVLKIPRPAPQTGDR